MTISKACFDMTIYSMLLEISGNPVKVQSNFQVKGTNVFFLSNRLIIQIIVEILSNNYYELTIFLLEIILQNIYHRSFALREWNSQSNL